jgi:hypothetical protein
MAGAVHAHGLSQYSTHDAGHYLIQVTGILQNQGCRSPAAAGQRSLHLHACMELREVACPPSLPPPKPLTPCPPAPDPPPALQGFPDEFHLGTLDSLLGALPELQSGVKLHAVMSALMDRLAKYAASDAKVMQDLLEGHSFDRFQGGWLDRVRAAVQWWGQQCSGGGSSAAVGAAVQRWGQQCSGGGSSAAVGAAVQREGWCQLLLRRSRRCAAGCCWPGCWLKGVAIGHSPDPARPTVALSRPDACVQLW